MTGPEASGHSRRAARPGIALGRAVLGASACFAALALAPSGAAANQPSMVLSAASSVPSGRMLVREVQEHLTTLGYDPGPVDGLLGGRTRNAIRAFQREQGRPETGEPTANVWRLLVNAVEASRAAAPTPGASTRPASEPTSSSAPPSATDGTVARPTLVGTTWEFRDETGAVFTITFEPNGGISGPPFSRDWTWSQDGEEIALVYENQIGGRAERSGRLISAREMTGFGSSSRNEEWNWLASRIR